MFKSPSSVLKIGDTAPDFTLLDQSGNSVRLNDFKGIKKVVLYFYPKDETAGCTAQACAFRDNYEIFKENGAEVIGISSDSTNSHQGFAQNHQLPFILLADPGDRVAKIYGVEKEMFGLVKGRVTFVIDENGKIIFIFNSMIRFEKHVEEALDAVKK